MQWIDKVIAFFTKIFSTNSFKHKYRTKKLKHLPKILKSNKWQVIDIRNNVVYDEHHLNNSTNIPYTFFNYQYYKKINKKKKILIINNDYRSNLDVYKKLKIKNINSFILIGGYKTIRNSKLLDKYTTLTI